MLEPSAKATSDNSSAVRGRDLGRWHLGLLSAAAVAFPSACVPRPPPASEVLRKLAQEGYTPNAGLSRLFEPGNVIQTTELDPEGKPRALSPPLVVAWASDCFPQQEPRESPFAVAAESASSSRALSLQGPDVLKFVPGLNLEA